MSPVTTVLISPGYFQFPAGIGAFPPSIQLRLSVSPKRLHGWLPCQKVPTVKWVWETAHALPLLGDSISMGRRKVLSHSAVKASLIWLSS